MICNFNHHKCSLFFFCSEGNNTVLLAFSFSFTLLLVKFNHPVKCFPSFWCAIKVQRLRLLRYYHHSTRIYFVKFTLVISH